jgi:hypothetical protein
LLDDGTVLSHFSGQGSCHPPDFSHIAVATIPLWRET